ncbi:hypothetical protein GF402_03690 [Candidatus Fermentibacteria bacterium]|nr:hypothetical protein [Candidatus Fermentibacteria bacterium]
MGCRVVVSQDSLEYIRQVDEGSGSTYQNGPVLHFGLPSGDDITLELYIPGDPEPVITSTAIPRSLIRLSFIE